ncbi:hypothetical protein RCKICKAPOO_93 [Rhodobacter phage RcKickapoo]|nr:hypothetical protein RCKICKAPOO_93 [Rhodobacter phage RcKickapoo]
MNSRKPSFTIPEGMTAPIIERGIPFPDARTYYGIPFPKLKHGDSFFVPDDYLDPANNLTPDALRAKIIKVFTRLFGPDAYKHERTIEDGKAGWRYWRYIAAEDKFHE